MDGWMDGCWLAGGGRAGGQAGRQAGRLAGRQAVREGGTEVGGSEYVKEGGLAEGYIV